MMAIIGVPINSKGAYVLDKFLKNQEEIQRNSIISVFTVFATEEVEFAEKLRYELIKYNLKADVIVFDINKPKNAGDRIWNIVAARNAIREYFLRSKADYLIFMDADMTFSPSIVNKLIEKAEKGYDVVYNGYLDKDGRGINLTGFGGTLIKRWVMERIFFKCKERKGRVVDECVFFELDLFRVRARVFRGFLVYTEHYGKKNVSVSTPRELTFRERVSNSPYFRIPIHALSALLCYDILLKAKNIFRHLKLDAYIYLELMVSKRSYKEK
jgi:glycosyltransferase involved in cell wall biosynthesis